MPRVTEAHLEMRRQQILDAALRCFDRDGFHATSMNDVIRESGLSAGAVYRYFDSKTALIAAAVAGAMERAEGALRWAREAPEPVSPLRVLQMLLERVGTPTGDGTDLARVGVSAWSEALRDPEVHRIAATAYRSLRDDMLAVLTRWRDAGHLAPDADLDAAARAMFGAVPGFVVQRLMLGDVDAEQYIAGLALLGEASGS